MILLDTHALIWAAEDSQRLGEAARATIEEATYSDRAGVIAVEVGPHGRRVEDNREAIPRRATIRHCRDRAADDAVDNGDGTMNASSH